MQAASDTFGPNLTPTGDGTRAPPVASGDVGRHRERHAAPSVQDVATSSSAIVGPPAVQHPIPPEAPQVRLTAEALGLAQLQYLDDGEHLPSLPGMESVAEGDVLYMPPEASNAASLYLPPESDAYSAGFQSYGDTDSLGELGELV